TQVQVYRRSLPERPVIARQQPNPRVETFGRGVKRLIDHPIATVDVIPVDPASDQIERATLPGIAAFGRRVLSVDGAHAGIQSRRRDREPFAYPNGAREYRPGDDGAGTRQRETPVDRQTKTAAARSRREPQGIEETRFEDREPLPGHDRDRHDLHS